jgi:hypothetical protein
LRNIDCAEIDRAEIDRDFQAFQNIGKKYVTVIAGTIPVPFSDLGSKAEQPGPVSELRSRLTVTCVSLPNVREPSLILGCLKRPAMNHSRPSDHYHVLLASRLAENKLAPDTSKGGSFLDISFDNGHVDENRLI